LQRLFGRGGFLDGRIAAPSGTAVDRPAGLAGDENQERGGSRQEQGYSTTITSPPSRRKAAPRPFSWVSES
jgi:hypothetical protein